MNFINNEIKIDFAVSQEIREFMNAAEQADKNNNIGDYMAYANNIDIAAKHCFMAGELSQKQWNLLCLRYEQ